MLAILVIVLAVVTVIVPAGTVGHVSREPEPGKAAFVAFQPSLC